MQNDVWIRDNHGVVQHSQVREIGQWTLPAMFLCVVLVGSLPGMIVSVIEYL